MERIGRLSENRKMFESTYTLYIEDSAIAASPSLEQIKMLAAHRLKEGKLARIRIPGGQFLTYAPERREWTPEPDSHRLDSKAGTLTSRRP
jgi:hypothetical protein